MFTVFVAMVMKVFYNHALLLWLQYLLQWYHTYFTTIPASVGLFDIMVTVPHTMVTNFSTTILKTCHIAMVIELATKVREVCRSHIF